MHIPIIEFLDFRIKYIAKLYNSVDFWLDMTPPAADYILHWTSGETSYRPKFHAMLFPIHAVDLTSPSKSRD